MRTLPELKGKGDEKIAPQSKCIDGLNQAAYIGRIKSGPNLDTVRYSYMAASVTGQCLSSRPSGPVFDGDTILFRDADPEDVSRLQEYTGHLVAVAVEVSPGRAVFMVKELDGIDYHTRLLFLKQYEPLRVKAYRLEDILKLYIVDEVQREAKFI